MCNVRVVSSHFSSAALRDLWWNKLGQVIQEEREKEAKSTIIQFSYHDAVHCIGYVSQLIVRGRVDSFKFAFFF